MIEKIKRRRFLATGLPRIAAARQSARAGRFQAARRDDAQIRCRNHPYAKLLTTLIPQFEEQSGAKVNCEMPSWPDLQPTHRHRIVDRRVGL